MRFEDLGRVYYLSNELSLFKKVNILTKRLHINTESVSDLRILMSLKEIMKENLVVSSLETIPFIIDSIKAGGAETPG